MCGLVGVAGEISKNEEDLFKDLLVMDTVRGYHSTGMAIIDTDRTVEGSTLFKLPVAGPDFVRHEMFTRSIPYTSAALIGHNRAATVGAINSHNAHPFQTGSIIGAHNGTLPHQSRTQLDDYRDYTTDSEALFHNIHKSGVELTLGSVWGAWALTYWDFNEDRLVMVRNKQRPLAYAYTKDRRAVMWASEFSMLYAAADRNFIELDGEAQIVPEDTVLEFDIPVYLPKGHCLANPKEVATVVPGKPPVIPPYRATGGSTGHVITIGGKTGTPSTTQTITSTPGTTTEDRISSGSGEGDEDKEEGLRDCDWCTARDHVHNMHNISIGHNEPAMLCGDCYDDPEVQQYLHLIY